MSVVGTEDPEEKFNQGRVYIIEGLTLAIEARDCLFLSQQEVVGEARSW
jgi:hypothetical protein